MYSVNSDIINLFQNGGRQLARIVFSGNGQEFIIDESDIVQGGLTIDRYSMTGSKIELGSAISSELSLKLRNYEGKFDEVNFEGAELFVEIGVKDWSDPNSAVTYIPCGYFIIDEPPRTLSTISISALDRMCKFAHWVNMNLLTFPITIENLVKSICRICGVELETDLSTLPNYDWVVESTFTGDGVTYQSIIQWCAFVMGACAFVDYQGKLVFSWYQSGNFEISPSIRYHSDLLENDIEITGLLYTNEQNQEYLFGTKDYAIESQSNILLQNNINQALTPVWNAVRGFKYRPFTASIKPAPFLYPLDGVVFVDKDGNQVDSYVTHITYTLNGACNVSAKGETAKREELKVTRLTPQQMAMIRQMENAIPSVASQLITAALTGYVIIRPDEILIMDTDDTATATSVWRWNRGGLGYSHGEAGQAYGGTYSVAIGMNGEIVADFIRSGTMFADRIRGGTLVLGGQGTSGSSTSGAMSVLDENGHEIARVDKDGIYTENFSSGNWLKLENGALLGGETGITTATIDTSAEILDGDSGILYHGLKFDSDVIYLNCEFFAINEATGTTGGLTVVDQISFSFTNKEIVTGASIDGNGDLQLTKEVIQYVSGYTIGGTTFYFRNGIMCTELDNSIATEDDYNTPQAHGSHDGGTGGDGTPVDGGVVGTGLLAKLKKTGYVSGQTTIANLGTSGNSFTAGTYATASNIYQDSAGIGVKEYGYVLYNQNWQSTPYTVIIALHFNQIITGSLSGKPYARIICNAASQFEIFIPLSPSGVADHGKLVYTLAQGVRGTAVSTDVSLPTYASVWMVDNGYPISSLEGQDIEFRLVNDGNTMHLYVNGSERVCIASSTFNRNTSGLRVGPGDGWVEAEAPDMVIKKFEIYSGVIEP